MCENVYDCMTMSTNVRQWLWIINDFKRGTMSTSVCDNVNECVTMSTSVCDDGYECGTMSASI